MSRKKKRTTNHHLQPRSRGGCSCDSNLVGKPSYIHRGWHMLFGNLYGEEVIQLLHLLRLVFGNKTPDEMMEIVRKEWVRR